MAPHFPFKNGALKITQKSQIDTYHPKNRVGHPIHYIGVVGQPFRYQMPQILYGGLGRFFELPAPEVGVAEISQKSKKLKPGNMGIKLHRIVSSVTRSGPHIP